ncbi:hypothetical protein O3M35_000587 [Rhynocoris fuscipes]|uniref:Uncharacterized protein n=1 Tax=Rhynocoris fuscipes TaxID=488301 RepID=A0AAW1DPH8_9HEMI
MVCITITFLIAVPYRKNPTLIPTKVKPKVRKKEKKKLELPVEELEELDEHFIKCDKELKYKCSISYKLFETNDTTISVVCWGKIAKIFLKDQVVAIRTVIRNDVAWISFSISHIVKPIKIPLTPKILEYRLEFSIISDNPKILLPKAQSDQPEIYYSYKEGEIIDCGDHEFEIILPTEPGEIPKQLPSETKIQSKLVEEKYCTLKGIPSYLHRNHVIHQLEKSQCKLINMNLPLTFEEQLEKIKKTQKSKKKPKSPESKSKTGKTEITENMTDENKCTLVITGEELLYEKIIWMKDKYDISSEILYAGVWLTTDTLIDEEARNYFQPIGVLLSSVENLPISDPSYRKCKRIGIKYSLGSLFSHKIPSIPIEKPTSFIDINNTKIFFTNNISPVKLLECFQSNKLLIEIYGHLHISVSSSGAMFTQESKDELFSKRNQTKLYPDFDLSKHYSDESDKQNVSEELLEEVLLGCAEINCFELICGGCRIETNAQIMSGILPSEEREEQNVINNFNTLEVYDYKPHIKGVLTDGYLIKNNTTVRICIKLLGPLNLTVKNNPKTVYFTRMLLVIKCEKRATRILKRLFSYNGQKIGNAGLVPCIPYYKGDVIRGTATLTKSHVSDSYHSTYEHENGPEEQESSELSPPSEKPISSAKQVYDSLVQGRNLANLITGFAIDNYDKCLIFVEGVSSVIDVEVWTRVADLKSSEGSILYDSDHVFTERLYDDFISIGGIYPIIMVVPMDNIFENSKSFLAGYIPVPAWRALLSIRKLLECQSMHMVIQEKLLPTCSQLICLNLEYGVPLYRNKTSRRK